jgi:hypothetical protein
LVVGRNCGGGDRLAIVAKQGARTCRSRDNSDQEIKHRHPVQGGHRNPPAQLRPLKPAVFFNCGFLEQAPR